MVLDNLTFPLFLYREEPVEAETTQSESWWGSSWLQAAKNKVI